VISNPHNNTVLTATITKESCAKQGKVLNACKSPCDGQQTCENPHGGGVFWFCDLPCVPTCVCAEGTIPVSNTNQTCVSPDTCFVCKYYLVEFNSKCVYSVDKTFCDDKMLFDETGSTCQDTWAWDRYTYDRMNDMCVLVYETGCGGQSTKNSFEKVEHCALCL
jgi:hypothetical protein